MNENFTWEYIDSDSFRMKPITEINYQSIHLGNENATIIETHSGMGYSGMSAGLQFTLKNNSDLTVTLLRVADYYLDKEVKPFFKNDYLLVKSLLKKSLKVNFCDF